MDLPHPPTTASRFDPAVLCPSPSSELRSAFRASLRLARYCKEQGLPETRLFFHNAALLAFNGMKPSRLAGRAATDGAENRQRWRIAKSPQ